MKKLKIAFIAMSYLSKSSQFISHTGMLYVSEYARKNGFESDVFDFSNYKLDEVILSIDVFSEYDVALFPVYDDNIANVLEYSDKLKKINSNIIIVFGGPSATSNAEYILNNYKYVDYITLGEGEINTLNILKYLSGVDKNLIDVGIGYRKGVNLLISKDLIFLKNLDDAPFPYTSIKTLNNKSFDNYLMQEKHSLSIVASRGCPFDCSFCAVRNVQSVWRKRSIENIMEEVKYKINNDKINYGHVFFVDAFFTDDFSRAISIGKALKKINADFTFSFSTRPEFVVKNRNMLRELKNVGCRSIELGIENFSDNILRYYNKKINERVIIDAITLLQDENIHIDVDYILFSPVVTFRELKYNVEKLIEHNFTNKNYIDIPFSSLVLFTGTKLRSIYHKEKDLSVIDIERFIKDKDVLIIYKIMKRLKLNYYDIIKNIIYDDFWKNDFKELNIIADVLFF